MEMTLNRYSEEKLTKPAGFMPNPTLEEKVSDWNFEKLSNLIFEPCHNLSRVSPELVKS